jgi:type I restriction enzyme S subunit
MSSKSKNLRAFVSSCETKKEEAKPALVPKLRFPEFRDADGWWQKEVGDLFQVTRGDVLSMTLVNDEKTEAKPYPVYSSQTKNNGLSGFYSDYLFEDAITWTTDGANAGDVNYRAGKFFCTNVCGVLLSSKGFANPCIAALINSVARKYVSYVGNPKLMNGVMSKIPIPLPPLAEQQKIAECLSSVDELIAAQARKVDALKTHKKGLMQQLFPREGETQPRLRFPEFQNAGEWGDGELGPKASKVGSGITPTGGDKNYKQAGRPFVRSQNVGWGILLLDDVAYIDEETHATFDSTEIKVSDVLLNITGASIGRSAVADERIAGGNVNQHVCIIRTKPDELNPLFLNQFLISQRGQKQIDSFQAGGNRQGLNFAQIRSFVVPLPPTVAEQQRIATSLSSLDALITAETQKHEALKTHKKGLMQQLFPAPTAQDHTSEGQGPGLFPSPEEVEP